MKNEKYWNSRIPLWMALLFLLNVFLIIAAELLFLYPHSADVNEGTLRKWDAVYEDCTILSSHDYNVLTCYLVETSSGETHLVTMKAHSVFSRRTRLISDVPVVLPESGALTEIPVKVGLHTAMIQIQNERLRIDFYHPATFKEATTFYTIAAALMELAELAVWEVIKRSMR